MKCSGHGDYASGDVAETGDKSALHGVFVIKRVLNRIWKWFIVFKWVYTNGVWFTTSIVWPMEYSI